MSYASMIREYRNHCIERATSYLDHLNGLTVRNGFYSELDLLQYNIIIYNNSILFVILVSLLAS